MYYCNVMNNEILTAPRQLPNDVSPETAVENGWYPVVFLNMPHQVDCNVITQIIEMKSRLNGTSVECWHEAVNKSDDAVELTRQLLLNNLRENRNKKLLLSDWTQLPTAPISEDLKVQWETYRQQLRDLPTTVDLSNIVWPSSPSIK